MQIHKLKTLPEYFNEILTGVKTFEVRYNDRDFKVGDLLVLREFDDVTQSYTGLFLYKDVTYILDDPKFVKEGFVILGIKS
jgi:ASC-1-like (ASCH) protein